MIKCLIIEDEAPAASRLEKLMLEIDPEIHVIVKLDSIESSIKWFKENDDPDLVMLDIQLADGLSFDIFKSISINSFVIFTTAYDEYAIKAFELNSIDYLLKPINKQKLVNALAKFKLLKGSKPTFDVNELISAIEGKKSSYKRRFAISIGTKIKSIEVKDAAAFSSIEKSTFLNTFSGNSYPVDFSLDRLEGILDPESFFRVSRQFIVNYSAIKKINILSKSRIEIAVSGQEEGILVSTAKTHAFREWLDR